MTKEMKRKYHAAAGRYTGKRQLLSIGELL